MARPADLLSVEEARRRILAGFHRLQSQDIPLSDALGRVLARPVRSTMSLPPFANSSMDGFAVRAVDTAGARPDKPVSLPVDQEIPAGAVETSPLLGGTSARIMTGAPLPPQADAVIPFEEVQEGADAVTISVPVTAGACVRPAGQDVTADTIVLEAGTTIGAPQIALLAALGHARVEVVRRPCVAILSTGDELVAPGQPLRPGQIYNSNTPMLTAAVLEAGGEPRALQTAPDDPQAILEGVHQAGSSDLLLTSGGASVGDFDHVKRVIGAEGSIDFWRVRLRPGKPLVFGFVGGLAVLGLPGNPTSALVTFEEFVRPAIRTMLGAPALRAEVEAELIDRIDNRGGRRTYARVRLQQREGVFYASLSGGQDSAMILPLSRADGLLIVPEDREEMLPGDRATVQVWHLPDQDIMSSRPPE